MAGQARQVALVHQEKAELDTLEMFQEADEAARAHTMYTLSTYNSMCHHGRYWTLLVRKSLSRPPNYSNFARQRVRGICSVSVPF